MPIPPTLFHAYSNNYVQIRANSIYLYTIPDHWLIHQSARIPHPPPPLANRFKGAVTARTQYVIKRAVSLLSQASPTRYIHPPYFQCPQPYKLSFITLTIPVVVKSTLQESYINLLYPWLRNTVLNIPNCLYFWRAEYQQRGALHYHVTTNQPIDYRLIRRNWNRILRSNRLLDQYALRFKSYDPNSTDVHMITNANDVENYLAKYVSKSATNIPPNQHGKIWGCSPSLKHTRYFTIEASNHMEIRLMNILARYPHTEYQSEHGIYIKFTRPIAPLIIPTQQRHLYTTFINSLKNNNETSTQSLTA